MIYYCVCDQDGFMTNDVDLATSHFQTNPTHTSHMGVGGDSSTPVPYSTGSSTISQVTTDPVNPTTGQMWVLASGTVGSAGQAMGVLGLTYSRTEVNIYQLSFKTTNGDIKRVRLV